MVLLDELTSSILHNDHCELTSSVLHNDQCAQKTDSQIDVTIAHQGELKITPQSSATFVTPVTHADSTVQGNLNYKKRPQSMKIDACDSLISTPTTI